MGSVDLGGVEKPIYRVRAENRAYSLLFLILGQCLWNSFTYLGEMNCEFGKMIRSSVPLVLVLLL